MDAQVSNTTSGKGQEAKATLRIATQLGTQLDDESTSPLLLSAVQGLEGISMPYSFDLTIFRALELPDLDPSTMINTPATIGMCGKTKDWTYRNGMITSFQKLSTTQSVWEKDGKIWEADATNNFHVYKAKLVPCFSLLANETVWRIYEEKTVVQILQDVFGSFSPTIPNSYLQVGRLGTDWPIIPYCVQFGETSFDFVTRLLDQFDIWYFFDHIYNENPGTHESMILGCDPSVSFSTVNNDELSVVTGYPGVKEIANFQRVFTPAHLNVWSKGFDIMDPTGMVTTRGDTAVGRGYNLLPREHAPPYQREIFPADLVKPDGVTETDSIEHPTLAAITQQTSKQKLEDEEVNVYTMQGSTKNPTFVAGRTFTINTDKTADHGTSVGMPQNQRFLLTQVSIAAFENTYGRHLVSDLQYILSSPVRWISSLFRDDARDQGAYIDPMSAMASGYLTQQLDATLMQGLVQSYFSGLQGTVVRHMDKYANAFIAVPYDQDHWGQIPSPDGTKPRAYGPHLAVVIGSSGTDISKSEVFADALGRVRVRFPWQTTGPKQAIESVDELLESDKCTAWVPVCEEWAGRGFGTQFLPRIGQQVLVHFLDGDPERPIITGRVYSTKGANTNLPFMPAASKNLYKLSDLPDTKKENLPLSGIRTRSTPPQVDKYGNVIGKPRFHLLRFDDTINQEQYLIRSQGRMDVTAFSNYFDTTGGDRHLTIGGKKITPPPKTIGGDYIAKVFRHYHLHVGDPDPELCLKSGNRFTLLEQNDELHVKKNSDQNIEGGWSTTCGSMSVKAGGPPTPGTIVLNASTNITLQVQNSSIVITPSGITLQIGPSSIVLTTGGIWINGPNVNVCTAGPVSPPVSPTAPVVNPPKEPTAADPGDTLPSHS